MPDTFSRRIGDFAATLLAGVLNHTLPQHCALCAQPVPFEDFSARDWPDQICHWCVGALPGRTRPRCPVCAIPNALGVRCHQCRADRPVFFAAHVLADYAMPLDHAVHQLKYGTKLSLARALGKSISQQIQDHCHSQSIALPAWPELIVAVPLSPSRLRERGYNQAALLAQEIGSRLGIPICSDGLRRIDNKMGSQTGKTRAERLSAMRNQFVANASVCGQRIALVDDVMTTGATVNAAATALMTRGASSVRIIAIARTP